MKLTIAHLYPQELNIYGDWGNIIALRKRLEWRGYEVAYQLVGIGEEYDFMQADIVFGGGGQDTGQTRVADDLLRRQKNLYQAVQEGVVFLTICGLYQLFGNKFTTMSGSELTGIGVFDHETTGSEQRLIGNAVIQTQWGELVGFENHSGLTTLVPGQSALGRVVQGYGNDGQSGFEGAVTENVFGTYLHGSLLPKNPEFTDELLRRAIKHKTGTAPDLEPLEEIDQLAHKAAAVAKTRPQ